MSTSVTQGRMLALDGDKARVAIRGLEQPVSLVA